MRRFALIILVVCLVSLVFMVRAVPGRLAPIITDPKDGSTMVLIPAGNFWMGSSDQDSLARPDERPQHQVYLDDYYIDMYEVSNALYKKFIDATGHRLPYQEASWAAPFNWIGGNYPAGKGKIPVVLVCRCDAVAYAQWAGKRLPTEAQWEKAARGPKGYEWPWGNQWDASAANVGPRSGGLAPVGSLRAGVSGYQVFDMAGNVYEWVYDWYDPSFYNESSGSDPMGPPGPRADYDYVTRGGSWFAGANEARCAARRRTPDCITNDIGFRCAKRP